MYDMSALMSTVFYACFGIVLMIAASRIIDFFIPGDFEVEIKRGNRAVAWLCAGSFIGVGEILRAVILSPYGEAADVGFLTGVTSSLLYAALGIFFFIFGFFVVNLWCRQYSLPEEIRKGNTAAGIMVFGIFVGLSLVISGAAWAGIRFLSPKDHSRRASRPATATVSAPEPSESPSPDLPEGGLVTPDPSWADGAHEVWSLDKEEGKGSLLIAGDQLFIITNNADFTVDSVAAYSISGSEPKEQWEAQLPDNRGIPIGVWGDYIFVDDQLIERSSGRVMEAPWSARVMLVIVINDTAIACYEKDACEAWRSSDPFSRAWSATIKDSQSRLGSSRLITRADIYVGERTILALSSKMLVDVDTGETFDLSAEGYMSLVSTTDGWIASDTSGEGKHTILSPTGEKKGTFSGNNDRDERFGPTLSQERPSSEQYRRYVENGDVSWAELRMSMDRSKVPGEMCPIDITIGNNTISDFYRPVDSANCSRYPDALAVSNDKKVVIAVSDVPLTRHSGIILAAWSFSGQQEIIFPGLDTKKSLLHLAGPSLIIASDHVNGKIRAYAPGNG